MVMSNLKELRGELSSLRARYESDLIAQKCTNREVLSLVEECRMEDRVCSNNGRIEAALRDTLLKEKHVILRIPSPENGESIPAQRNIQLARMLDPDKMLSISQILIVAQAIHMRGHNDLYNAEKTGNIIRNNIYKQFGVKHAINGPFVIGCSPDDLKLYDSNAQSYDLRLPEEPRNNEPHVRISVFRFDCGSKFSKEVQRIN